MTAVLLSNVGGYRCDPRRNRHDVDAQFTPPIERLALETTLQQEYDLSEIHVRPLTVVVDALHGHDTWHGLLANLPDMSPAGYPADATQTVLCANAMASNLHGG